ncbi:hypothetical protein KCP70_04955 [Salmonella enterica subsp. enterica]|nr:hypothetical protein KCP70_04955 [Salmonella enterica subsp. enterica]
MVGNFNHDLLSEVLTYINEGKVGGLLGAFDSKIRQKNYFAAGRVTLAKKNLLLTLMFHSFRKIIVLTSDIQFSVYKLASLTAIIF